MGSLMGVEISVPSLNITNSVPMTSSAVTCSTAGLLLKVLTIMLVRVLASLLFLNQIRYRLKLSLRDNNLSVTDPDIFHEFLSCLYHQDFLSRPASAVYLFLW
jgi:hypothetical protein